LEGAIKPSRWTPLEWTCEEKTEQFGCCVLESIGVSAEFPIHPQTERIGKTAAKYVSARDRFERLRGIVQPGSIDFEIEQMTTLGPKLVGVSFGSRMPDYRSRRTDSFFPPKDFHVGPSQKEGNVRLFMLVQGKPLAWRMELLNDPEGTDLLRTKSVAE
jgi:hypothetical protein